MTKIPNDSTVASVWPHLAEQRIYVAGVRHKMLTCQKQHGNAHVRIGITGSGQQPCYRVFYLTPSGTEVIYGSYWDTHDAFENPDAVTNNWSTASMDFDSVDTFLREKVALKKA
ncbi:hypothetical protein ACFQX9_22635 [Bradyrhizobium sp. GCM10028915]|uniref:hypothetical protein n=1 Tax=Bradyrhizobium sp. GCM10028915 TaxID=3273385 RepID=UPI003609337D